MTKLTTLKQIREALAEEGAMLVKQDTSFSRGFSVQRFNGQRIACAVVADRLTWVRKDKTAGVKFSHRTALEIFWVPNNR